MRPIITTFLLLGFLFAVSACGGGDSATTGSTTGTSAAPSSNLPIGDKPFPIDPSEFTTEIANPYWPMKPGSRWIFRETDAEGSVSKVVVTVLDRTKKIANGVEARIVHDQVSEHGEIKEDTYDWYAQDKQGNVWYLGEDTTEFAKGKKPNHAGSFEAGVKGAQAGVVMPASPKPATSYRQEYLKGEAEDQARILRLEAKAKVPYGSFDHVLVTKEWSPLEPGVAEHKYYAAGVGDVKEVTVKGPSETLGLVKVEHTG